MTSFDRSDHFGRLYRMSLSISQNPAHKNNNQTRSGLGLVFITGMYRSIGHVGRHVGRRVEFPKVLLNEKRPIAAYENESIWSGILPCPTIMTIVLFCDDLQKSCKRIFDCILYKVNNQGLRRNKSTLYRLLLLFLSGSWQESMLWRTLQ